MYLSEVREKKSRLFSCCDLREAGRETAGMLCRCVELRTIVIGMGGVGCRVRNGWYRAFPVGHQEPGPLAALDHHCSEFCLQLSGQVAESSAGLGWNGPHLLSIAI